MSLIHHHKENRKALGFLITLYRKRLTSSFYAVKESLKRRLEGISITPDDLNDIDDADDSIIQGLESYLAQPTDSREIAELEKILRQFENTGEDSKLSNFLIILRQELNQRESAIVFNQYTVEQAVMSTDPAEEGVLLAEFDKIFDAPPLRPAVDDLVPQQIQSGRTAWDSLVGKPQATLT